MGVPAHHLLQLRYANNSNYKNDEMITREVFVSQSVLDEVKRIVEDSEVRRIIYVVFILVYQPISYAVIWWALVLGEPHRPCSPCPCRSSRKMTTTGLCPTALASRSWR